MGDGDGRTGQRLRPYVVVGGVIALILGLAIAVPKVFPFLRGDREAPLLLPDAPVVADYLIVAASVLVVVAAVALRLKVASIADPMTVRKRRPVLLQILIFLAIFWLTAFLVAQLSERREQQQRGDTSVSEQGGDPNEVQRVEREGSRALGVMLTVVLGGVIVVLAGSVYLITKKDRGARAAETSETLADELAGGVEELRSGKDPRDVVIACYARMERILEAAGAGGRPSDTPSEFVERALRKLHVPAGSVRRLTELFERARFSTHGTDEDMRHEAIAALEDVRASLGERT